MSRFWWLTGLAAVAAIEMIRRRFARASTPKVDEVSTDWLADARSRSDEPM